MKLPMELRIAVARTPAAECYPGDGILVVSERVHGEMLKRIDRRGCACWFRLSEHGDDLELKIEVDAERPEEESG